MRVFLISDLRVCRKCNQEKSLSEFTKNRTLPSGHTNDCKKCTNAYLKNRRDSNPEIAQRTRESGARWRAANPEADKRKYLMRKFNITLEEYKDLLNKQNGVCAICGEKESVLRRAKSGQEMLAIDHCHVTGKIRGLLCFKCNTGIGALGDSVEGLERALSYLRKTYE
jgi:hypothetical protein